MLAPGLPVALMAPDLRCAMTGINFKGQRHWCSGPRDPEDGQGLLSHAGYQEPWHVSGSIRWSTEAPDQVPERLNHQCGLLT